MLAIFGPILALPQLVFCRVIAAISCHLSAIFTSRSKLVGFLCFYANSNLATTLVGARIVLWPGSNVLSSTDWYGFGMN